MKTISTYTIKAVARQKQKHTKLIFYRGYRTICTHLEFFSIILLPISDAAPITPVGSPATGKLCNSPSATVIGTDNMVVQFPTLVKRGIFRFKSLVANSISCCIFRIACSFPAERIVSSNSPKTRRNLVMSLPLFSFNVITSCSDVRCGNSPITFLHSIRMLV